jgi:hypothetical protein
MIARSLAASLLVALCCSCGSSEPEAESERTPSPSAAPSAEEDVAAVAERYTHSIAERDWEAACETRVLEEQRDFARRAGSCGKMFKVIMRGKPVELFADAEARDVRVNGDIAGVDLHQPGQAKPVMTLAVVRDDDGRWRLKDVEEHRIP